MDFPYVTRCSDSSSSGRNVGSGLIRCLKDRLDTLKAILPRTNFLLNSLPLLKLDLTKHVILDDNHLVQLVDFSVDDIVLDGIDCPHFDLILIDLRTENEFVRLDEAITYVQFL